jgi:hypothetical protein
MYSTIVLKEKFRFTGKLECTASVYLGIKSSRDYKSFWLENSNISFDAEKGNFRFAKISGSKTQLEDDILSKRILEVEREIEELENSVNKTMTQLKIDSLRKEYISLEKKRLLNIKIM